VQQRIKDTYIILFSDILSHAGPSFFGAGSKKQDCTIKLIFD